LKQTLASTADPGEHVLFCVMSQLIWAKGTGWYAASESSSRAAQLRLVTLVATALGEEVENS
jgi:hypothetical protein